MLRLISGFGSLLSRIQTVPNGFRTAILFGVVVGGAALVYLAIGTHPYQSKLGTVKIQDRLIAVAASRTAHVDAETSALSPPNSRKDGIEGFSVNNIRPTNGFVAARATRPTSPIHKNAAVNPTSPSKSRTAAGALSVSLPTRKPRPIPKKAQSSTAQPKAKTVTEVEAKPKPLAFGSIGYNYDPRQ